MEPKYKPTNWIHEQSITIDNNMSVKLSISENSGRVKMEFGRFDDGKYAYTHDGLNSLFSNDIALGRVREYLRDVKGTCDTLREANQVRKDDSKNAAVVLKRQAAAIEALKGLSAEQVQAIADALKSVPKQA